MILLDFYYKVKIQEIHIYLKQGFSQPLKKVEGNVAFSAEVASVGNVINNSQEIIIFQPYYHTDATSHSLTVLMVFSLSSFTFAL